MKAPYNNYKSSNIPSNNNISIQKKNIVNNSNNINKVGNTKNISKIENKFSIQKSNISNVSTNNSHRQTLENNISNIYANNNRVINPQNLNKNNKKSNAKSENLGNTIFKGQKFIDFQEPFNESIRPIKPQSKDFEDTNKTKKNNFLNFEFKNAQQKQLMELYKGENNNHYDEEEFQVIENYSGYSEEKENCSNLDDFDQEDLNEKENYNNDFTANNNFNFNYQYCNKNSIIDNENENVNNKSLNLNRNLLKNKYGLNIDDEEINNKGRKNSIHFTRNIFNTDRGNVINPNENEDLIRKSKYFSNLKVPLILNNNNRNEYISNTNKDVENNNYSKAIDKFNTPEVNRIMENNLMKIDDFTANNFYSNLNDIKLNNDKNFPNFETIHSLANENLLNNNYINNTHFINHIDNDSQINHFDPKDSRKYNQLTDRNNKKEETENQCKFKSLSNNNITNNKCNNKNSLSFNPNNFINNYNLETREHENHNKHLKSYPINNDNNNSNNAYFENITTTQFSNNNSNSNNTNYNLNTRYNEKTGKFNSPQENSNNKMKTEEKNLFKNSLSNANLNEKENLEQYIFQNINNLDKEILANNSDNRNFKSAVEVLDLNHFQQILLNAENAIKPTIKKKIDYKESIIKNKENYNNSNNITNFSSIPVDESPPQNLNIYNLMKDTNNADFLNILVQLKKGLKNDNVKNTTNCGNINSKIDDESQSYIKDILDICSDGNKNNLYQNEAKNNANNVNSNDMNTINLNNVEILSYNMHHLNKNSSSWIDNNNLPKSNFYSNFNTQNNDFVNNHIISKFQSNSVSPLKNNVNLNKYEYQRVESLPQINLNDNDNYFNNSFTNNSELRNELVHKINNQNSNMHSGFNGKNSQSSNRNKNNQQITNKQSNRKLETNDLIEISNRRKNLVNDIGSMDGYFRRRHLETLMKIEKIKKEKIIQEEKENKHIPKINKKSREIANRICGGSLHNIQINQNNQIKISKGINNNNNNNEDHIEVYYENIMPLCNNNNNNVSSLSYNMTNGIIANNINNNRNVSEKELLWNSQPVQGNSKNNIDFKNNSILREIELEKGLSNKTANPNILNKNENASNKEINKNIITERNYNYNNIDNNKSYNKYTKLEPKIENKRHKSAGNTARVLKQEYSEKVKYNQNYLIKNDNSIETKEVIEFQNKNNKFYNNNEKNQSFENNKYPIMNQAYANNTPIINFEINNNIYNPNRNYNQNLPIENAIQIKRNYENKRNLQLEVPDAKNYILTSTDLVNYGTKTNQSKPINDLKNIFNNNNSPSKIHNSGNKTENNNLNTLESITRKFMFSYENNLNEFKPGTKFSSIENNELEKDDNNYNLKGSNTQTINNEIHNPQQPQNTQPSNTQPGQVRSSIEHVQIDIFNTDISISRISTHQKESTLKNNNNNDVQPNDDISYNNNNKNKYPNTNKINLKTFPIIYNDVDLAMSASKSSIQLFPVNERTDADLNFNMEVFTNEHNNNQKSPHNNNSNFCKDESQFNNNRTYLNKNGKLIYNRNNNINNINNFDQTETIYQNLNTNSSRDADTIPRLNTEGTVNSDYNHHRTIKNSIDSSEILQAFSEKNNKQNKSTTININNIPEIKNNINKKKKNLIPKNKEKNNNLNNKDDNKSNFIFTNNLEMEFASDFNRNEISPIFDKKENNPRNVTNTSNIIQNNQSINISKFTNFVGNSNISNINLTNNLTHLNTHLNNNQNNNSNFKNLKKPNIPKIFSGNNYYQNIINNTANKTYTTNISNKNMVQSYLSTERNDKILKSNNDKKIIKDNSDLNINEKFNNSYSENKDSSNINPIKPMINLSISYEDRKHNNLNPEFIKNEKFEIIKQQNNLNVNKYNYFDSDKFIFSSKADSKNEKVFNFDYNKTNDFLKNKDGKDNKNFIDNNYQSHNPSNYGKIINVNNYIQDQNQNNFENKYNQELLLQFDCSGNNLGNNYINENNKKYNFNYDSNIGNKLTLGKNNKHYNDFNNQIQLKTNEKNFIEIQDEAKQIANDYNLNNRNSIESPDSSNKNAVQSKKLLNPKFNNFKMNIFEKMNKNPFLQKNNNNYNQNINNHINISSAKVENNENIFEKKNSDGSNKNNSIKILKQNNSVKSINNPVDYKKSFETKSITSHERYAGVETEENRKAVLTNMNYLNINSLELNKRKMNFQRNENEKNMKIAIETNSQQGKEKEELILNEDNNQNYFDTQKQVFRESNNCYNAVINLEDSEMPSTFFNNTNGNLAQNTKENCFPIENFEKDHTEKYPSKNTKTQEKNQINLYSKGDKDSNPVNNRNENKRIKTNKIDFKNRNIQNKENKNNDLIDNKQIKAKRLQANIKRKLNNHDQINTGNRNSNTKIRNNSKNLNGNFKNKKKIINKEDELNPKYHKSLNLQNKYSNNIIQALQKNQDKNIKREIQNNKLNTINIGDNDEIIVNNFFTDPENNNENSINNSFNEEIDNILDDENFYTKKNESYDFSYSCKSMKNDLKCLEKLEKKTSSEKKFDKAIKDCEEKNELIINSQNENEIKNFDHKIQKEVFIIGDNILTTEGSKNTNPIMVCKTQNYDTTKFSIEVKNSENFNRVKTEEKDDKIKLETVQEMNNVISKSVKLQRISQENCQQKIKNFLNKLQTKQENQEKNVLNDMQDLNFTEGSLIKSGNSSFRNEVEQDLDNVS